VNDATFTRSLRRQQRVAPSNLGAAVEFAGNYGLRFAPLAAHFRLALAVDDEQHVACAHPVALPDAGFNQIAAAGLCNA
jgi:hypothetical protein